MATRRENIDIVLRAKNEASSALSSVTKSVAGIAAAYFSLQGVTSIIKGIIDVGIESEQTWTDVAAALKRHGVEVDSNISKIQKFSGQMQEMTGISDEEIGKQVQAFIDYGQSVEGAMNTTRVAMDLAAGGGMDLKAATDLLAKASVGYTSTLSRYGIIIDENIPKSEKFAKAIEQINERFGGAAEARADTMAVKWSLVSEKLGDFGEKLFEVFSPSLLVSIDAANSALDSMIGILDWLFPKTKQWSDTLETARGNLDGLAESSQAVNKTLLEQRAVTDSIIRLEEMNEKIKQGVTIDEEFIKSLANLKVNFEDFAHVAPDATNAIVEGIDLTRGSLASLGPHVELTQAEIDALFEKTTESIVEQATVTGEVMSLYLDEYRRGYEVAFSDIEQMTGEYERYVVGKEQESTRKRIALINGIPSAYAMAMKSMENDTDRMMAAAGQFTGGVLNEFTNMSNGLDNIFSRIANHFIDLVLNTILASVTGGSPFVTSFLGAFKFWDVAENDRAVIREGHRFVDLLTSSMQERIAGFAPQINVSSMAPGVAVPAGDTFYITVNSSGGGAAITAKAIEEAVVRGKSRLAIQQSNITGGPYARVF